MWKRTEEKSATWAGHPPALLYAILALTGSMAGSGPAAAQAPRSVRLLEHPAEAADFDLRQSAALFVGIRRFTHDSQVAEVPYAVDDAVDLAFSLSLDLDSRLVEPGRVVLALSGEPRKPESQQRLSALAGGGRVISPGFYGSRPARAPAVSVRRCRAQALLQNFPITSHFFVRKIPWIFVL